MGERKEFAVAAVVWGKGKVRVSPPSQHPDPKDLNTGFKRRIKNNEDMDRWFLFISSAEEINVTLIM